MTFTSDWDVANWTLYSKVTAGLKAEPEESFVFKATLRDQLPLEQLVLLIIALWVL